jgi:hypothetical protein
MSLADEKRLLKKKSIQGGIENTYGKLVGIISCCDLETFHAH